MITFNLAIKCNFPYLFIFQFRGKKKRRKTEDLDVATTPTSTEKKAKLGKKKLVYGVNLEKFVGAKATPEGIAAISKTSGEPEFEKRESVFVKFRPQIQAELRLIYLLCPDCSDMIYLEII